MESKELVTRFSKEQEGELPVDLVFETYNAEYEACCFSIGQKKIRSRLAKKTPTKKGYFVVFWEKDANNNNQPFSEDDPNDVLLVNIIDGNKQGQFVFPKELLVEQGVLKREKYKGKIAMRVYPSWEKELNTTAERTQKWQLPFFKELTIK